MLFESTLQGIGTNVLKLNKVENDNIKSEIRLLSKIENKNNIKILRYKNLPNKIDFYQYISKYTYKQYPINKLKNMAKKHKIIIDYIDKKLEKKVNKYVTNPGEVCSTLICNLYKDIGINLFKEDCSRITPSDFYNMNIFEDKSSEILCYEDTTIKNNQELFIKLSNNYNPKVKELTKLYAKVKSIL